MEDDSEVTEKGPTTPVAESGSGVPGESTEEWTSLLGYLLATRGFDFHGYKPASLERRIRKRMDSVGLDGFSAYQDYLEVHPNEFEILFNTILINVTSFFRDPAAWEAVRDLSIP
jgi:two-component system, chemotaxis family, CheB/CheR fusion protein